MFNVFSLLTSKPLDEREIRYICKMICAYVDCYGASWLAELPWMRFTFKACPAMTTENGIMGCFSPLSPDVIHLQRFAASDAQLKFSPDRPYWVETVFPTIIHELRHAWQFKKNHALYVLCCLPVVRHLTIENDAKAVEVPAVYFAEHWTEQLDRKDAEKISKKRKERADVHD